MKNPINPKGTPVTFASKKIKTVSVSPDKKYKTIVKEKMGPKGSSTTVTDRRTIKGALTGAPKVPNPKKPTTKKKK